MGNRLVPWGVTGVALVVIAVSGCESLQRKFTRAPKHPAAPPNPIISFQDYSRAMTPLDRYRKHCLMFDYWNAELVDELRAPSTNSKRFKRASGEALNELETMRNLVADDMAVRLAPLIDERSRIDRQLRGGTVNPSQTDGIRQTLEVQSNQIRREFFWRDMEEHLKPQP